MIIASFNFNDLPKMTLHIFNPEHEYAMAADMTNFTPPHAARVVRSELAYLPALWAQDGDIIIVDDVPAAINAYRKLKLKRRPEIKFVTLKELRKAIENSVVEAVEPWGWDKTVRHALLKAGAPAEAMPDNDTINAIRMLSNRATAVELLGNIRQEDTAGWLTGHAVVCHDMPEVEHFVEQHKDVVLKAPWSCSGRGVRYVTPDTFTENIRKWTERTLMKQQTMVAEVKCDKVLDFAVEFMAEADGTVRMAGLSLFNTINGAYKGNVIASEAEKRTKIERYIPSERLDNVINRMAEQIGHKLRGAYTGPLGVDMLVADGSLLNPCVEINLRRTMGHAALARYERSINIYETITN